MVASNALAYSASLAGQPSTCGHGNRFCIASGFPPNLNQVCRWPHEKQRIERSINNLHQAKDEFGESHQERHDTLAQCRFHSSLRIGDHEEDEQLIHWPGNRRDFGAPWIASNPTPQKCEKEK